MLNTNSTVHGNNIAEQINNEDAYGNMDDLTLYDIWNIIHELHSHIVDFRDMDHPVLDILERCMDGIEGLMEY